MNNCHDCREQLAEYALGGGGPASAAVAEHLPGCPDCRQELEQLKAAWAALPLALPTSRPSPALFDRILARIDAQAAAGEAQATPAPIAAERPAPLLSRGERILSYVLAASVLVALTWGAAAYYGLLPSERHARELADQQAVENLARRLGTIQQMEKMLQSDSFRLVSLHKVEAGQPLDGNQKTEGYVVWDLAGRQWHFFALGLPPAPAGSAYQLWMAVSQEKPLSGGPIKVTSDGIGSAVVDVPSLDPAASTKVLVTLESDPKPERPSGKTVLEADL